MKAVKIFQKIFLILLIILFLLIVIPTTYIFFAKITTKELQPTFFGYASAVVISGSMNPTIKVNDFIITKSQKEYEINDIVMFVSQSGKSLVTHRIIEITEDGIRTKGDANNAADNYVTQIDNIVGKVIKIIPNFGLIFSFIISPWGILCLFIVGTLVIEGPFIIKKLSREKNDNMEKE